MMLLGFPSNKMSPAFNFKTFLTEHLVGTRAYIPLRDAYQSVFNRAWVQRRRARRDFYRQFVQAGSLVFDVGANMGEYSHTFLQLGARVVAIEPNPSCCAAIRALGHKGSLATRCEAIGDRQGEVTLLVGSHSGHSTVSEEWMHRASENDPGCRWDNALVVRMNTLDRMRQEYGTPDFIKIDVEGYEVSVLRGMSFRPSALSFEFHAYAPEHVRECLLHPIFASACVFNIVVGDSWELLWPEWHDSQAVLDYISTLSGKLFGDIYAKFDCTDA